MRRWAWPLIVGAGMAVLAWQATLIAMPRAIMGLAVSRVSQVSGMNHFTHAPLATAAARAIVRPSPDLAYSSCPYDLSGGAVLIEAKPVPSPYWSLSVFDAATDAVFVRNGVQAAGKPVRVVIARPGQAVLSGAAVVRVSGDRGVALVRILIANRAAFAAVDSARREAVCRQLRADG